MLAGPHPRSPRADALEDPLHILVAEADASVRLRKANRSRLVGAVDAVAFLTQPDPSGADRIPGASRHGLSAFVEGGIRNAVDDRERPHRTRRRGGADGDRK